MKKLGLSLLTVVIGFCFMGVVNAAEASLSSIATITSVIGGPDEEIVQTASGTYKYYYKVVALDDSDFATYISAKYIVDNGNDASDEYAEAQSRVTEYETTFNQNIAASTTADLSTWTQSTDKQINLTDIKYEEGKHHGYVLGVAAVKDGDSNIYMSRSVLESKSATTLGLIEYNDADKAAYEASTQEVTTNADTQTETNPNTGIEDYAIYLVPISIVLGSGLILRRNFA